MSDPERPLSDVLAAARTIASVQLAGVVLRSAVIPIVHSPAAAHCRAESEGRPVGCNVDGHFVVIFPIGAMPE